MRILIDIGHPAHVHYFKNFIWIMQKKGHEYCITARDKEVSLELLDNYSLKYINRGKGAKSTFGKILYLFKADYKIFNAARKFKPDILLSFASPYLAHVSFLTNRPHITFDDTEHAKLEQHFYIPFSKVVLTPSCFQKDLGKKQIYFKGYMELCYLYPKYFMAKKEILKELELKDGEKFIIIRFVSWNASHDIGQTGLSYDFKIKLISELKKYAKIFISSEKELPPELKEYQIKIRPEALHTVLNSAVLYIGEGATTASECAALGTPAIYVNSLDAGTLKEQEKFGLIYGYRNTNGVLEKAIELLQTPNIKDDFEIKKQKMLSEKIDVTGFMVWFIEHYPESVKIMKEDPEYQLRFK